MTHETKWSICNSRIFSKIDGKFLSYRFLDSHVTRTKKFLTFMNKKINQIDKYMSLNESKVRC